MELLGGLDIECDPPPGRVFAVGPAVTFETLADAINSAFGRWDLSHLHVFELADGREIGFADDESDDDEWLDHGSMNVGDALRPGDEFVFTFDLGDNWQHRCRVLDDKMDPQEVFGEVPPEPVVLSGWGWLPDQYGRVEED